MNLKDEMKAIGALTKTVASHARRLKWNIERTAREHVMTRARARLDQLMADETFRRLPSEHHQRVLNDLSSEEQTSATRTASVALFWTVPQTRELEERYPAFVSACREDTPLTFPNALDHISPGQMLQFYSLQEQRRPLIDRASAGELRRFYSRALDAKDSARSLVDAILIEERCDRGGLAETAGDLPIIKELMGMVDLTRDLRVPFSPEERAEIEQTLAFGKSMISLAQTAGIRAVNPNREPHTAAAKAFDAESGTYADALAAAAVMED